MRIGAAPTLLAATDRAVVAAGRHARLLALVGVVLTGFLLEFSEFWHTLFSYAAVRVLHWLCGLVLLIDIVYRVSTLVSNLLLALTRAAKKGWRLWENPFKPEAAWLLGGFFWAALSVMLLSGIELAVRGRYGFSIIPFRPPIPWIVVHGTASAYLAAALALRFLIWSRAYLRTAIPYLRSP